MPPRRPSPSPLTERDRALHAGQAAWANRVALGLLPDGALVAPLSARLRAHPAAWARWSRQHILADDLLVFLWHRLQEDHRTPAAVAAMGTLVGSWRTQAELLHAHPLLAEHAIRILLSLITPEIPLRTRRHRMAVLAAVLRAAPSGAPARFGSAQLVSFIHLMDGDEDEETGDLLSPLFAAQLDLPPRMLRTAWPPLQKTPTGISRSDRRACLTDLLEGAPTVPHDAGDLPGRLPFGPARAAATGWSFYATYIAGLLQRQIQDTHTGLEDLRWAWSHPAWRPALVLYGRNLLFDTSRAPWQTPAEVAEALAALDLVKDAFLVPPHDVKRVMLFAWLRRSCAVVPIAPWARCALAFARGPADFREAWVLIGPRLRAHPTEVWTPDDWLPWLESPDPTIRAEAMLLVSAPRPTRRGRTAHPR